MTDQALRRVIALGIPTSESDARQVLGVTSSADYKAIRTAYRQAAQTHHPDRFSGSSELSALATEAMQIINAAWEMIEALHAIGNLGKAPNTSTSSGPARRRAAWSVPTRAPRGDECDLCGSWPAERKSIYSIVSIVVFWSAGRYHGTVCRSCGTALFNQALRRTMIGGWWGLSALALPVYAILFVNTFVRLRAMRPPTFRDINVASPFRGPAMPPRSPLKSPLPLGATAVALVLLVLLFGGGSSDNSMPTSDSTPPAQPETSSDGTYVGMCFKRSGDSMIEEVRCDESPDLEVSRLVDSRSDCVNEATTDAGNKFACLRKVS